MNRFLISIFTIPSLLSLTQSCSLNFPSKGVSTQAEHHQTHTESQSNPSENSTQHSGDTHFHSPQDQHSASLNETKVQLTQPQTLVVNQPQTFLLEVVNKNGEPITNFETFQEKLMHLIIVSDDLEQFDHLHPEYDSEGLFKVEIQFPQPGSYTLVSDYKPMGSPEQVSISNIQVPGTRLSSSVKIEQNWTQTLGNTKVSFIPSQSVIKSGQDVTLKFNLNDTQTNQPIDDLKPYLGEKGHLVIFKQSTPLTQADYIHAHALQNTPSNEVHFMTQFPEPGNYKIWGQFNRDGQIITASFWIKVS